MVELEGSRLPLLNLAGQRSGLAFSTRAKHSLDRGGDALKRGELDFARTAA